MDALIWVDWVIIVLIAVSTLISLKRGFVREALSLVTWVAAFLIARTFHPQMQALLESSVETPLVRLIAAFAILFFGTLIVGAIINNMVGHLIRATGLSATDRVLGMGFGLLRGLVVVVVMIAFLRYTPVAPGHLVAGIGDDRPPVGGGRLVAPYLRRRVRRFLGPADEASNAPGGEEFVEPVSASR